MDWVYHPWMSFTADARAGKKLLTQWKVAAHADITCNTSLQL
jgi:hypothetical protein